MRNRVLLLVLAVAGSLATFVACVGDEVGVVAPSSDGGGTSVGDGSSSDAPSAADATLSDGAQPFDAGVDAQKPYDVRSLTGLRLWLESTQGLAANPAGSTVYASWSDSSQRWDGGAGGGAPDGGQHVALPQNVNPPSIVANGIAGRPTVSFIDGNGYLRVDNHADFSFGLGEFLIVEVAKVSSGSGPLWNLRPNATAGSEQRFAPGQLCVAYGIGVTNGCTTPVFAPTTEPHVFVARRKADVFTVRVDGDVKGTLDRSGDPPDIFIADFQQPFAFIGGGVTMQVSELVIVVGPTSDANVATLEGHLKSKYAIP